MFSTSREEAELHRRGRAKHRIGVIFPPNRQEKRRRSPDCLQHSGANRAARPNLGIRVLPDIQVRPPWFR